ncbi:aldehyde dehydrogenase [Penicillium hispanicum]|uniref:aldehyde dehydrogenase n=1 Tax=Penicillium hispanicum TaxID=1080232 RepID=UPI002540392D|nr:aldehyde dehydrogenase [Penicillium hispanicum]KAJ5591597.1 aldehyde dehydrogenase [Penicillium hispanicum]
MNGNDILISSGERITSGPCSFQGATDKVINQDLESCDAAFDTWSNIPPTKRRALLHKAAENLRPHSEEFSRCIQEEIYAPPEFADFNIEVGSETIKENAALVTDASSGSIPISGGDAYALVFKEPLRTVLTIAPWNTPIILGLRGIMAPLAASSTVLFKVYLHTPSS